MSYYDFQLNRIYTNQQLRLNRSVCIIADKVNSEIIDYAFL